MKDPNNPCLFCNISKKEFIFENVLAFASYDSYPVSKHHCLIIPKRHIKDFFDLTEAELIACNSIISLTKKYVQRSSYWRNSRCYFQNHNRTIGII